MTPNPDGKPLARVLTGLLPTILQEARKQVGRSRVDLSRWQATLLEAAKPWVLQYWLQGYRQQATSLLREVAQIQQRRRRHKSLIPEFGLQSSWDLFRPEVTAYVQQASFLFAQSTIDTIASHVADITEAVREELGEALSQGETTQEINTRMGKLFLDPNRAAMIGQTEAQRAMGNGAMLAAHQSGVASGLEWLASSDACPLCQKLHGKQVKFGEAFYIHPKGGPYATIYHPPAHPRCFCSTKSVLDMNAADRIPLDVLRNMANLGRVASRSADTMMGPQSLRGRR